MKYQVFAIVLADLLTVNFFDVFSTVVFPAVPLSCQLWFNAHGAIVIKPIKLLYDIPEFVILPGSGSDFEERTGSAFKTKSDPDLTLEIHSASKSYLILT